MSLCTNTYLILKIEQNMNYIDNIQYSGNFPDKYLIVENEQLSLSINEKNSAIILTFKNADVVTSLQCNSRLLYSD